MRMLARLPSLLAAASPALAVAQAGGDGVATGASPWNWVIGVAAVVVVAAMAWDLFGPAGRRRRDAPRAR